MTNDTKHVMVAVKIAADGIILPLTIVFKGKPDCLIVRREFQMYPTTHHHYQCQDNAWMDNGVMIAWVNKVLKPYIDFLPDHIIPLLILHSYHCHMMALVVTRIQELGIEVKHASQDQLILLVKFTVSTVTIIYKIKLFMLSITK
jgi:hypothetical protein